MTTFRKKRGLLVEKLGSDTVLFDPDTNLPYTLNPVASFIYNMMDGKSNSVEIAQRVCEEYDVEFDRALDDLLLLFQDLAQKGIIEKVR